jgi:hypothetical protein
LGRLARESLVRIGTLAWALALALAPPLRAQDAPTVPVYPAPSAPSLDDRPLDRVTEKGGVGPNVSRQPEVPPPAQPRACAEPNPLRSFLDTAGESLFGDAHSDARVADWRPLSLGAFFTDGWLEPYVDAPAGSRGAPRGGWANSFEGTFYRAWFIAFAFANGPKHNGTQYLGKHAFYAPLNRRFELRVDLPFVASNKGLANETYHDHFGDMVVGLRFLLSANRDFSQVFALNVRTPTGSYMNGNGVDSLSPQYQFWYNPYGRWAVRGGAGFNIPTGGAGAGVADGGAGSGRSFLANLGVGHYWSGAEGALLRNQWLTLVANLNTPPLAGRAPSPSFLSLTPGYCVQLPYGFFFITGLEVPVTRHSPFAAQPVFLFAKQY